MLEYEFELQRLCCLLTSRFGVNNSILKRIRTHEMVQMAQSQRVIHGIPWPAIARLHREPITSTTSGNRMISNDLPDSSAERRICNVGWDEGLCHVGLASHQVSGLTSSLDAEVQTGSGANTCNKHREKTAGFPQTRRAIVFWVCETHNRFNKTK